jgi:hypothetical protein
LGVCQDKKEGGGKRTQKNAIEKTGRFRVMIATYGMGRLLLKRHLDNRRAEVTVVRKGVPLKNGTRTGERVYGVKATQRRPNIALTYSK